MLRNRMTTLWKGRQLDFPLYPGHLCSFFDKVVFACCMRRIILPLSKIFSYGFHSTVALVVESENNSEPNSPGTRTQNSSK
jgi:hypothetical protein